MDVHNMQLWHYYPSPPMYGLFCECVSFVLATPTVINMFKLLGVLLGIVYCFGSEVAATVPLIKLSDGKQMPALALGTWLGNTTQARNHDGNLDEAVEKAVGWALAAGYRHIDTAYAYKIEDQVGRALSRSFEGGVKREDVFVTTKLWNEFHPREQVVPALRKSLTNLGLDYVDLYLIHWPVGLYANKSFEITDYLETWRGMIEAKELGLTKSIGLSNFNERQIDRIRDNGLETPVVLQVELNLNLQQPALLAYCKEHNITVMGYTPFGSLFYNKAKEDAPAPRVDDPALTAIAQKYGKNVPQVVLRYLVELGVVPLPKSLTQSRIEQNILVFDFTLTDEEKNLLKGYDKGYRTIAQTKWSDHPYYPF